VNNKFWLWALLTTVGIAIAASLGFWQLDRAAQKSARATAIESQAKLPVLSQTALLAAPSDPNNVHRNAILRGRWLPEHTVYLDNRQMDDKVGYFVLTPLLLEVPFGEKAPAMVIQRGWVARNFLDRQALPTIESPEGIISVSGRIAPSPSKLFELGTAPGGKIRQNIDLPAFSLETGLALLPLTLLQTDPPSPNSVQGTAPLERRWPQANLGLDKHYGYAVQWFSIGGVIAVLFIWFQFWAPRRRRDQRELVNKDSP
jgi:surfeit locus 1 family protein